MSRSHGTICPVPKIDISFICFQCSLLFSFLTCPCYPILNMHLKAMANIHHSRYSRICKCVYIDQFYKKKYHYVAVFLNKKPTFGPVLIAWYYFLIGNPWIFYNVLSIMPL